MDELMLLTDGSVNTQSDIGYGAYLAASECRLSLDSLRARVKVRRFEHTSSMKLELQTLLWALKDIQALGGKVIVYTDSQNIMGLPGRRERLEQNNYHSKEKRLLNNHELYQEFYRMTDQLNCTYVKVRGHQSSNQKVVIDRLFTLVDKASRNALRGDKGKKMRSKAQTVSQYLREVPDSQRDSVMRTRTVIKKNLNKGFVETMNWGMISYEVPLSAYPQTYNKQPLSFAGLAAQKNNISLYLMCIYQEPGLMQTLKDEFKKIGKKPDMGKSCIRFKNVDDVPIDAIGRIIKKVTLKQFIRTYEGAKGRK